MCLMKLFRISLLSKCMKCSFINRFKEFEEGFEKHLALNKTAMKYF